jgi:hypothetical protein
MQSLKLFPGRFRLPSSAIRKFRLIIACLGSGAACCAPTKRDSASFLRQGKRDDNLGSGNSLCVEYRRQHGGAQQLVDFFVRIQELQMAALFAKSGVGSDQFSDTGAVDKFQLH